uniref:Uncharacterized protein n=1 Tax=Zea mays TaxID=4577 RepID=C4J727_MAIZE|nr:unknown [Zea mays]
MVGVRSGPGGGATARYAPSCANGRRCCASGGRPANDATSGGRLRLRRQLRERVVHDTGHPLQLLDVMRRQFNHLRRRRREVVRHDRQRLRVVFRPLLGRGGYRRGVIVLRLGAVLVRLAKLLEVQQVLDREPVFLDERPGGVGVLRGLLRRGAVVVTLQRVHPGIIQRAAMVVRV